MDGWHLRRHVSERSFRRQGRPGAGLVVHKGGYGMVGKGERDRSSSTEGRRAQKRAAAGARRHRGPGRGPGRDAAALYQRRRLIMTSPGRSRTRPPRPLTEPGVRRLSGPFWGGCCHPATDNYLGGSSAERATPSCSASIFATGGQLLAGGRAGCRSRLELELASVAFGGNRLRDRLGVTQ